MTQTGRVTLEELIWREQGYSTADQRLFLSMMRSCGICFIYRRGPRGIEDDEMSWTIDGASIRPIGRLRSNIRCCIRD